MSDVLANVVFVVLALLVWWVLYLIYHERKK
jgi:hypothetical protein